MNVWNGLAIGLVVLFGSSCSESGAWSELDSDDLIELSGKTGKIPLIYFTQESCKPCRVLDVALESPEIAHLISNRYVTSKIEIDYEHSTSESSKRDIQVAPTLLILDQNGHELAKRVGYSFHQGAKETERRQELERWLHDNSASHPIGTAP